MAAMTLPLYNSVCSSPTTSTSEKLSEASIPETTSTSAPIRSIFSRYYERLTQWRPWKIGPQSGDGDPRAPHVRCLPEDQRSYRSLSVFLNSDEEFRVYPRFGYLHTRLLLTKQHEIRELEAELDRMDEADEGAEDKRRARSRKFDVKLEQQELKANPAIRTRTKILEEIENKLKAYDELLLRARALNSMSRPSETDYRSVENYMFDKKPLIDEEQGFIYDKNDLVTLREGREGAYLDKMIEKFLQTFHCMFLQDDRRKTTDPNLHYYSKSRKDIFVTSLLVLVLLLLLILPVFLLYRLTEQHNIEITYAVSIGVLLVFTLMFSAVLSLFTQAKRHEIFGAAAGYCAVLVVFISNIPDAR
ncbi:Peptidase C14 caspase domain protein [Rutstroemia sp. NJR-2017a BBW]|nr:Peptidase C14 caspase domain protein [Rutstroemia sp. NJR-2017a BBW]